MKRTERETERERERESVTETDKQSLADLQPEQVVHSADDDVDGGGAASLGAKVVLEVYRQREPERLEDRAARRRVLHLSKTDANSPLLWPSHSSWRKRNRSQVNSSSAITFSSEQRVIGQNRVQRELTPGSLCKG